MSRTGCAVGAGLLALGLAAAGPAAAAVWEVDAGAACPGSGTLASPFCTIGQAAAVAVAGDTVNVAPGNYREQVSLPTSGAPGLPITFQAAAGARVLGTDNLSGAGLWVPAGGNAWSASYTPDTVPQQLWVNGQPLALVASVGALVTNSFFYDSVGDILYVDIGGGNPGNQDVEAGARSVGFDVIGRSHIVITGFVVRGQNLSAIRVRSSSDVAVRKNRALRANSFGIVVEGSAAGSAGPVEVAGNETLENGAGGIRLRNGVVKVSVIGNRSHHNRNHGLFASDTTDSLISGNHLFENALPGGASTTGMLLQNVHRLGVERNLAYANQDTGIQLSGGSAPPNTDNAFVRNISFANGDHGIDIRASERTNLVSNTVYANANDGFSIEGNAPNTTLANNVAAENGLLTGGNDLFVDASSTAGFSADYDLFWRSNDVGTVRFGGVSYATIADFAAATGHEAHGVGGNPNFANPANGNFIPGIGPAIDSANAAAPGFQAPDFAGNLPHDILSVANTGAGVPDFADRGALERRDFPPIARLEVRPRKTKRGFPVLASGLGSRDDGKIVGYRFDFGDGTVLVQSLPLAVHTYRTSGIFQVRLTVTDDAGQTDTKQQPVQVK